MKMRSSSVWLLALAALVIVTEARPRKGKGYERWWEDDWDDLDEWWKPENSKQDKDDSKTVPGSYSKTIYTKPYRDSHPDLKNEVKDTAKPKAEVKDKPKDKAKDIVDKEGKDSVPKKVSAPKDAKPAAEVDFTHGKVHGKKDNDKKKASYPKYVDKKSGEKDYKEVDEAKKMKPVESVKIATSKEEKKPAVAKDVSKKDDSDDTDEEDYDDSSDSDEEDDDDEEDDYEYYDEDDYDYEEETDDEDDEDDEEDIDVSKNDGNDDSKKKLDFGKPDSDIVKSKPKLAAEKAKNLPEKPKSFPEKPDEKPDGKMAGDLKDFTSTKPDPKTSPNPPPPGLGSDSKAVVVTPPGKEVKQKDKFVDTKKVTKRPEVIAYIESKPLEFCKVDFDCRIGRMCKHGICVCQGDDACVGHNKPVCGSDGVWYPSHCELHRTACVKSLHIRIDHKGLCFNWNKDSKAFTQKKDDVKSVTKTGKPEKKFGNEKEEIIPYKTETKVIPKKGFQAAPKKDQNTKETKKDVTVIDAEKIFDYTKLAGDNVVHDYKPYAKKTKDKKEDVKGHPKNDKYFVSGKAKKMMNDGPASSETKKEDEKAKKPCTEEEFEKMKEKLLLYHCKKFAESNCQKEVKEERQYLATLMFSHYDLDFDYYLEESELKEIHRREKFDDLSATCELSSMMKFEDKKPQDKKLSVAEFLGAFELLVTVSLPKELQVVPTLATSGNGLELRCGITGAKDIVWQRYSVDIKTLASGELTVFEDGSLFFSKVDFHHIGNYTCLDRKSPSVQQIHVLSVQMPPVVRMFPTSQVRPSFSDIVIKCHAEGVPKPRIHWMVNEMSLPDIPNHFIETHENGTLMVHNANFQRDTGAYKCVAHNQAGEDDDVSSVFIINPNHTSSLHPSHKSYGTFVVFSDRGYTAYEPENCLLIREANGNFGNFKFIPDTIDAPLSLCEKGEICHWGSAVNVRNKFVYVSQPTMNRVVILEASPKWNPIQVVDTDKTPMSLQYMEHLDQVWVVCWNERDDGSMKTIVIIRDASKNIQHHAVHPQPVGNRFDLIKDLYLPPANDLRHHFDAGFVTHNNQKGLSKLDLVELTYTKAIDLTATDCIPKDLAFVPIGGYVVIQCLTSTKGQNLQLVMDFVSNMIVSKSVTAGKPVVSPDSRHLVTVDKLKGRVAVSTVSNEGKLEAAFEVTVSNAVSDSTFFPSSSGKGFDLVLTAADSNDIIFVCLSSGKVEKIKGTKQPTGDLLVMKSQERPIINGGVFGDHLFTPLKNSISVINGHYRHVQCEFQAPSHSQVLTFTEN